MDILKKQVAALSSKIDALQAVIDRLPERIAEAVQIQLEAQSPDEPEITDSLESQVLAFRARQQAGPMQAALEHKDVLVDDSPSGRYSTGGERELAPEIQLQRLTAQLTAAYNRIAALEEQLLSHRIPQ
ncbi:hypothetical protein [Leptolyngbya sp. FACHB-261]|uniref:hypothetical protein n=1 Tax=Leptolyngbya sp. FACHB-261 TaxID=2692806 RepID=UPI001684F981|nr:hypothetical protein [Leptolyngbya sp. FACHB-261]MBD2101144.1 hypothetical protein [Leptolyngbya sp. FACHB-261]